jgi:hypothetical protein
MWTEEQIKNFLDHLPSIQSQNWLTRPTIDVFEKDLIFECRFLLGPLSELETYVHEYIEEIYNGALSKHH